MIWDGKRPCDFQLWDEFRRSKDVVHWFGSFALGRGGMFWTNLCALYFLLWAASSKNCRLDGKMDPQRQTPRCKRTHPGFTGWNHSKMRLQTPGGTKKVSGMDWQKASDHEVIMISSWPWVNCYLQLPICHRFVTEISDQLMWVDMCELVLRTLLMLGGELRPRHLKEAKAILELAAMLLRLDGESKTIVLNWKILCDRDRLSTNLAIV